MMRMVLYPAAACVLLVGHASASCRAVDRMDFRSTTAVYDVTQSFKEEVPGSSVPFFQSKGGCVTVTFSAETSVPIGQIYVRPRLDDRAFFPASVAFAASSAADP